MAYTSFFVMCVYRYGSSQHNIRISFPKPNKQFSSEVPNCKQVPLKVSKKKISETIQFIFIFLNIREIYLNVSSFLRDSPEVC